METKQIDSAVEVQRKNLQKLKHILTVLHETEEVAEGTATLVKEQTEQITRVQNNNKTVGETLNKSNNILHRMLKRWWS